VTTWQTSLESAANSVKSSGFSTPALKKAGNEIQSSTQTLVQDVKKLGRPPTQAGKQEQQAIDQLTSQIQDGVQQIHTAIAGASGAGGVLSAVSTVSGTISTITGQIKTTYRDLLSIDKTGELKKAFDQADACQSLRKSASSKSSGSSF